MAAVAPAAEAKAIFHPIVDGLVIGGLSIGFIVFLLVFEPSWNGPDVAKDFVILAALLNWPHFTATYRLLYASKETVERYPWSTKWMPLLLGLYCIIAGIVSPWTTVPMDLATLGAALYLAWHYTGQTWGMMATFSYLTGAPFEDREKKFVRFSLRCLLSWHVVWVFYFTDTFGLGKGLQAAAGWGYGALSVIIIAAAGITGAYGMRLWWKRIDRSPPARVLIPWVSVWMWYAAIAVWPFAIFWAQLSHALQYMMFPARVEANRYPDRPRWQMWGLWVLIVFGSAFLIFKGTPALVSLIGWVSEEHALLLVAAFINIHHFFADGAIWKISNPAVRKELFAHLKR